jgi:hypothetical protein
LHTECYFLRIKNEPRITEIKKEIYLKAKMR